MAHLSPGGAMINNGKPEDARRKTTSRMTGLCSLSALLVAAFVGVPHTLAAAEAVRASTQVFSHLVGYQLPSGFVPAFENTNGPNYIQESVLAGETVDEWSQMITLTANRDLGKDEGRTPVWFANVFGEQLSGNCPETFTATQIQETEIQGHAAFAGYFSCGRVITAPVARSEMVTILFIKADQDFLTLQWAERGEAQDQHIGLNVELWKERMARLYPVTICTMEGEGGCKEAP